MASSETDVAPVGELNETLKRVRASCALIEASLSVALVSSSHLLAQVRSRTEPFGDLLMLLLIWRVNVLKAVV